MAKPVYTNKMPVKVNGERLDTLAYNVKELTGRRMLPATRTRDIEVPGMHGVVPSTYDDYGPGQIILNMWLRSRDLDGSKIEGKDPKEVLFDNIDRIFHLFKSSHKLIDFRQQFGPQADDRYAAIDNPRLDKSTGTTVVRTNSITDPSFEGATTPVTTRTNLIRNPSFEQGTNLRWTAGQGCTIARIAGSLTDAGSWMLEMTATGAGDDTVRAIADSIASPVVAGEVYTASAWVGAGEVNAGTHMNIYIRWMAPNNIDVISESYSDEAQPVSGYDAPSGVEPIPSFVSVSAEAPVGVGFAKVVVAVVESLPLNADIPYSGGVVPIGQKYYVDAVLLENSPTPGTYFDGSYTSIGASWTGTANDSTSIVRVNQLTNWSTPAEARIYEDTSIKVNGIAGGHWESLDTIAAGTPLLWQAGTRPAVAGGTTVTAAVDETRTAVVQSDSSLTVPLPRAAGLPLWQDGQLALLMFNVNDNAEVLEPPAGWATLNSSPFETGTMEIVLLWKYLDADEDDPTLTIQSGNPQKIVGLVATLLNYDSINPFAVIGAHATRPGTQTTIVAPSVTTTQANQLLLGFFAEKSSAATTVTVPGMVSEAEAFTTGSGEASCALFGQVIGTAGATGTRTATYNISSGSGYGILIAIKGGVQEGTGTVASGAVYVKSDMDNPPQLLLKIAGIDGGGALVGYGRLESPTGPEQAGALMTPGPGWWRYRTENIYLPIGSVTCRLQITSPEDIGSGTSMIFDAASLELAPQTPNYFDGDSGTGYNWLSTADGSYSQMKRATPDGWVAFDCTLAHTAAPATYPVPEALACGEITVTGSFPSIGSVDITPSTQGGRWTAGAYIWGDVGTTAGATHAQVAIRQKQGAAVTNTTFGELVDVSAGWTWVPGPEVMQTFGNNLHMRVHLFNAAGATATNGSKAWVCGAILTTGAAEGLRYFDETTPGAVAPENLVSGSRVRKPPDDRLAWSKCVQEINPTVVVDAAGGYVAEFGVLLSIPGTFWSDTLPINWVSPVQNIAHTRTYDITNLQGATAPMEELIFIVYGGGGSQWPRLVDPVSGAYVELRAKLPNGQAWRYDSGRWKSGRGASSLQSTSSSWADAGFITYFSSPRARFLLTPIWSDELGDFITRVQLYGAKQLRVIGKRQYL